ncbi:unnamed protein product [Brassicogethes aeneus]|uniref:Uncharacterized protein n=1 Tax=Brassicogethes aeneus TaxID=1431903 RepID=A0A9P0FIP9_BRAAE|nr:unnamed protein product [Brassicogethes aeneus]
MAKPTDKCNHNENRRKVCGCCGSKIIFGNKPVSQFCITSKLESLIKVWINEDFDVKNEKCPNSICGSCRLTLLERDKNNFKRPLPCPFNFASVKLQKETRQNTLTCECQICLCARKKTHILVTKGRGRSRHFEENNFPVRKTEKRSVSTCKFCFKRLGKGIRHICNYTQASENIKKSIETLPIKKQEQVFSSTIKRLRSKQTGSNISNQNSSQNNFEIKLSTGGKQAKIIINPVNKKKVEFSQERLNQYQIHSGSSSNQMRILTNFLRSNAGKKSVPKNYRNSVKEKSQILQSIYQSGTYEFEIDHGRKEKRPAIWADAEELVNMVIEQRRHIGNCKIKIMADGGQGFFKICLSLIPENYCPEANKILRDEEKENECLKKITTYEEGGTVSKIAKITGVYKTKIGKMQKIVTV